MEEKAVGYCRTSKFSRVCLRPYFAVLRVVDLKKGEGGG